MPSKLSSSRSPDSPESPSTDPKLHDADLSPTMMHDLDESKLVSGLTYADLTMYQKKSILCIFFLCGFGYFLDLCWAQSFGLVLGALQAELGIPSNQVGTLKSCFAAGLTVGALFWGLSVDIIGRRWCFNLTCLISSIFGFIFAAPSNYGALCFIAACIGFGVGGNIPTDATITLEFLPTNRRFLLAALSFFQPLGIVVTCLVSFGVVPKYSCSTSLPPCKTGVTPCCTKGSNMGWQYLYIILGCITMVIFAARFILFTMQESPKYLLAKGRDEEAIAVVRHVAAFNKAPIPNLTIDDFRALDAADKALASVSTDDDALINGAEHKTAGQRVKVPLRQTYLNYIYVYLPGTVATLMAAGMLEIPKLGRKYAMFLLAGLLGASLFLFSVVNSLPAFVSFNAMEYFFQSAFAAALYAYTPEACPAPVRGSASGMLSTLGRLASTVAPVATQSIFNPRSNGVLFMAGGGSFLSALAILTLPFDTRGKHTF